MINLKNQIQTVVNDYKSGNLGKAESSCKRLLYENTKIVFLYNLYGLILSSQNKIDEAIRYYEKGLLLDPNFAMLYNNLGLLHEIKKNLTKAESCYVKSMNLDSSIVEPHNNLGKLYNSQSKYEKAIKSYKKAIEINPKISYPHYNLAQVYITLGKFKEAKKLLILTTKINPNFFHAHKALNRIHIYKNENDEHLKELIKIYTEKNSIDLDQKMFIAFSLAKAYEEIKNFKKSFNYYKEANSIFRKKLKYSRKEENSKFSEIKKIYSKSLFKKYSDAGNKENSPIFILGMPRSGTTLVEQIISSHPQVFGADEVEIMNDVISKYFGTKNSNLFFAKKNNLIRKSLLEMGNFYIKKMKELSGNLDRYTDKYPANFFSIGLIKLIFPKAKVINCHRTPEDNCLSIYKNHFTSLKIKYAYNLDEIVDYYNLYTDLMNHWKKVLPNFVYNISYENLVSNTRSEIKNILKFCDLEWHDSCLSFYKNTRPIKTASDTQVRKRIYKSSINTWLNYKDYLKDSFKKINII